MRAARFKVARDTLSLRVTPAINPVPEPVSQLPTSHSQAIDAALERRTNFSTSKAIDRGRGEANSNFFTRRPASRWPIFNQSKRHQFLSGRSKFRLQAAIQFWISIFSAARWSKAS